VQNTYIFQLKLLWLIKKWKLWKILKIFLLHIILWNLWFVRVFSQDAPWLNVKQKHFFSLHHIGVKGYDGSFEIVGTYGGFRECPKRRTIPQPNPLWGYLKKLFQSVYLSRKKEKGRRHFGFCRYKSPSLWREATSIPMATIWVQDIKVIRKIRRLGAENGQFRHNKASTP
jgi:hypothetical protein